MNDVSANGAQIPALGFGTWDLRGQVAADMVSYALDIGYRHIDTAVMYDNENEVGQGLRQSGANRDAVFVTTKIWPADFAPADFRRALRASLTRLQLDYVDLLLLHWPNPKVPLADTLGALADAKRDGLTRHIGVSNFNRRLIDEAVALSSEPIVVNQIEYHVYLDQSAMIDHMANHNIALAAYCPIARGKVFDDPVLVDIAAECDKDAGQVALKWIVQQSQCIALPRTSSRQHAKSNLEIFDFSLTPEQMRSISALTAKNYRTVPANGSFTPDWNA